MKYRKKLPLECLVSKGVLKSGKLFQEGFYALHYAVIREDIDDEERHEVIAALLDAGADVNVKTTEVRLFMEADNLRGKMMEHCFKKM